MYENPRDSLEKTHGGAGFVGLFERTNAEKIGHFNVKATQITFAAKGLPGVCEFEG